MVIGRGGHNQQYRRDKGKAGAEIGRNFALGDEDVEQGPRPFMNRQVVGLTLNKKGTNTVEPNMANRCWILNGILSSNGGRSST